MDEILYKVEKIKSKKFDEYKKAWVYLIQWQGYDSDDATWEPEENLCYIPDMVEKFNKKWEAKQSLKKKKKQERLTNLAMEKRNRLSKLRNEKETFELARGIEELINLDEEEDDEEKTVPAKKRLDKLPDVKLFDKISAVEGGIYTDKVSKIIGIREYRGILYAAVLYRSSGSKVCQPGIVEAKVFKSTQSSVFRSFLQVALKNPYFA